MERFLRGLTFVALVFFGTVLTGCKFGSDSSDSASTTSGPVITLFQVVSSSPTNSQTYNLLFTSSGPTVADYCILENDVSVANCSWVTASLPSTFNVSATNNAKVLSAWVRDADGNTSARSDSASVTLDTVPPSDPSSLSLSSPASSPGTATAVTLTVGGVTAGDIVKVYSDSGCSTLVGQATASSSSVNVSLTSALSADGTYDYYATATDPATNPSACSSATVTYDLDRSVSVVFTAPSGNTTVTANTYLFTWGVTGAGTLRSTNPYHIEVYAQAACAGSATATSDTATPQYTLNNIVDGSVYSIGVTAYNSAGVSYGPVCSDSVTGNAIIANIQVASGAHYLAMDVDFTHHLAYLGAEGSYSSFFDAVDFADETNPSLFRAINTTSTPSTTSTYSRGIGLYNGGTRLVVASDGGSKMELYDLTADPRTGTWSILSTTTGLQNFRKIAKIKTVSSSVTRVYAALRRGAAIIDIAEPAGTTTVVSSSTANGNCYGNGAVIADAWMLTGCYNSSTNFLLLNLSTYAADQTFNYTDGAQWTWDTSVSADGSKIFSGAGTASFFSYNASDTPQVQQRANYKGMVDYTRDSVFVEEGGHTYVYSAGGNHYITVWDVTDIAAPLLVYEQPLAGMTGEGYAIRVDIANHRAYVTSVDGRFYIVNTQMMRPATSTITAF